MAVDPVSALSSASGASGSTAASAAASASLNYNDFLKLLITQMKTQDPTDPMDASEQISQLASFSQVEQQVQTNSHLETVLQNQMLSQAADYIGKEIASADGTVTGTIKEVSVYSDGIIAVTNEGKKLLIQPGVTIAPAGTKVDTTVTGTSSTGSDSDTSSGA
jgi:flagellar basal-body rod modification protein FlgD